MKRFTIFTKVILVALIALVLGIGSAQAEVVFNEIMGQQAISISSDGLIAVGGNGQGGNGFSWTAAGGIVELGQGEAWGATNDGVIVGEFVDGDGNAAAGYHLGVSWIPIGGIPGQQPTSDGLLSSAYAVSADGSKIAGMGWHGDNYTAEAFYWTQEEGVVGLGQEGGRSSRANVISPDGTIIAGWQEADFGNRMPAVWTPELTILGNEDDGEINGMKADGSVFVGSKYGEACFWNADGERTSLFADFEYWLSWLLDVSGNDVMVGSRRESMMSAMEAFLWTEASGVVTIADTLASLGVTEAEGWLFLNACGISDDGNTIVGWGAPPNAGGELRSWIIDFDYSPTLEAPGNVLAEYNVPDQMNLSWTDNSTSETGYKVDYRYKTNDGEWGEYIVLNAALAANTVSLTHTMDAAGGYQFRVAAFNDESNSDWVESNIFNLPDAPEIPTNFTAEFNLEATQINLDWDDNSFLETGYRIEKRSRTLDGEFGDWAALTLTEIDVVEYTDTGIENEYIYGYRLRSEHLFGNSEWVEVETSTSGIWENGLTLPTVTEIEGNYPNPFNGQTTIHFSLAMNGQVEMNLYNIQGQLVKEIVSDYKNAGRYQVAINLDNLSSGTYISIMRVNGIASTHKVVLIN